MGLWLGASILSIFQIVDYFTSLCVSSCCQVCSSGKNNGDQSESPSNGSNETGSSEDIEIGPDDSVVAIHYHKAAYKLRKKRGL